MLSLVNKSPCWYNVQVHFPQFTLLKETLVLHTRFQNINHTADSHLWFPLLQHRHQRLWVMPEVISHQDLKVKYRIWLIFLFIYNKHYTKFYIKVAFWYWTMTIENKKFGQNPVSCFKWEDVTVKMLTHEGWQQWTTTKDWSQPFTMST